MSDIICGIYHLNSLKQKAISFEIGHIKTEGLQILGEKKYINNKLFFHKIDFF